MRKSRTKPALHVAPSASVQISLAMQQVLAEVKHAFMGLCIDVGKQVLATMMEADRVSVCGVKGVPDPQRQAVRGGHTSSEVVLGGQRIRVRRPRARELGSGEVVLPSFAWASARDPLDAATLSAIAAGVSTRRYASTQDRVAEPEVGIATSKSAVSRRFVALSEQQLEKWLSCSLKEVDLPVVMIDGIHFRDRVVLLAMGIDSRGKKHLLGLHEGSTESTRVVGHMLSDLIARGLDAECMRLWVIDGGKALRRAITEQFGQHALIQRCQEHKRRNVIDHLPEDMHAGVNTALRKAWECTDAKLAKKQLVRLVGSLHREHPGAAASLSEGLEETLTAQSLGVRGALYKTLRTTNPIENLNGMVATYTRNVKRWKDGKMVMRWIASALSDASDRFRRIRGLEHMPAFLKALQTRSPNAENDVKRKAA